MDGQNKKLKEVFNKVLGNIKNNQTELKNTLTEMKLRDFWDNVKHTNIHIIGVPEGEEREKGPEKMFEEIIAENFP